MYSRFDPPIIRYFWGKMFIKIFIYSHNWLKQVGGIISWWLTFYSRYEYSFLDYHNETNSKQIRNKNTDKAGQNIGFYPRFILDWYRFLLNFFVKSPDKTFKRIETKNYLKFIHGWNVSQNKTWTNLDKIKMYYSV